MKLVGVCVAGAILLIFLFNKNQKEVVRLQKENKQILQVDTKMIEEQKKDVLPPENTGVTVKIGKKVKAVKVEQDVYEWSAVPDVALNDKQNIWLDNKDFFPCKFGENNFQLYMKENFAEGGFQRIYESEYAALTLSFKDGQFDYHMSEAYIFSANKTEQTLEDYKKVKDSCKQVVEQLGVKYGEAITAVKGQYCYDSGVDFYEVPVYYLLFHRNIDGIPVLNMGCEVVYSQNGIVGLSVGQFGCLGQNFKENAKQRKYSKESCLSSREILALFSKQAEQEHSDTTYIENQVEEIKLAYRFSMGNTMEDGIFEPCWALRVKSRIYDFEKQEWERDDKEYCYSLDGKDINIEDTYNFSGTFRNWEEVKE